MKSFLKCFLYAVLGVCLFFVYAISVKLYLIIVILVICFVTIKYRTAIITMYKEIISDLDIDVAYPFVYMMELLRVWKSRVAIQITVKSKPIFSIINKIGLW